MKPTVFIATPCYGGMVSAGYVHSLLALLTAGGLTWEWRTIATSLIPLSRAALVSIFLESGKDRLLFIDADIIFQPEPLMVMLKFDKEFVAGAVTNKKLPPQPLVQLDGEQVVGQRFQKAVRVGFGFVLLARSAIERMMGVYHELRYEATDELPAGFDLFRPTVVAGTYLGEDYAFCHRWRHIGGEIWIDSKCILGHEGAHTFWPELTPPPA